MNCSQGSRHIGILSLLPRPRRSPSPRALIYKILLCRALKKKGFLNEKTTNCGNQWLMPLLGLSDTSTWRRGPSLPSQVGALGLTPRRQRSSGHCGGCLRGRGAASSPLLHAALLHTRVVLAQCLRLQVGCVSDSQQRERVRSGADSEQGESARHWDPAGAGSRLRSFRGASLERSLLRACVQLNAGKEQEGEG